jgi:electron transfer flavoprotein alpha subunit
MSKLLFWIAVAVALGFGVKTMTKKDEGDTPEPDKNPEPTPQDEANEAPTASTQVSSEHPTLVMKPEEAQKVALESMKSESPTETPGQPEPEAPSNEAEIAEQHETDAQEPEVAPAAPEPQAAAPTQNVPAGGNAVLVLLDVDGGTLSSPNRATLSAAQQIAKARSAELHVCCLGADTASAAQANCEGATAVHSITDSSLGEAVSEGYTAAAISALNAVPADVIVGPASTIGKGFLPRLAEHLGCGMITEILSVESGDTFTRALWAGSAIATVQGEGRLVISVRATGFDPAETSEATPQAIDFEASATRARFVSRQTTESARPDLSEASVVVSGGRGTKGDFAAVEQLTDALGGAMGASRAACDAGWVPNDLQVGQTGKVVAPNLYIAAGISGAIQHIAGMKGSKTIVAINKDEEAPIFQVADYGLVADLFDACPELAEKITSQGLKPTG